MAFRPPPLSTFVTAVITGLLTAGSLLIVGNATIYGDATVRSLTATSTAVGLSVAGRAQIDGNVTTTAGLTPATANAGSVGSLAYPYATGYFGTSLAVPAISVTSTGAGITLYNTTDQVTNFEKANVGWSSNVFRVSTSRGGTGTSRDIKVFPEAWGSSDGLVLSSGGSGICFYCFTRSYSSANTAIARFTGTNTASSNTSEALQLDPTINQSGTADYNVLSIDPTITAEGSGGTKLLRLAVGGTDQFYIDKNGYTYAGGSYAGLSEGDGYYFGDSVRGLRFLTGDDFEFQNWHVGGQFYMSVYNGSARTRFAVFDAPTKRSAFSSSVDLRNYTPNTDLEVIGTASATKVVVGDGSSSDASIQFSGDADTGIDYGGANTINLVAGGVPYVVEAGRIRPALTQNGTLDFGSLTAQWNDAYFDGTVSTTNIIASGNGTFRGQVSSTSLIVSATGTIRELNVGNAHDGTFGQALLSIKHSPTQTEVNNFATFATLWNTSSTLPTEFVFMNDNGTQYLGSITAFGRNYPVDGDFGFSPANMMFYESTSGTVMTAGDAVVVISASGALRPLTGLGFGNNNRIDPFGATASTTITNGNMASASLDFPNSAAAGTQDLTITVMGARDGDECQLGVLNALASRANEAFTCFVSADDTITVRRTCVNAVGCGDPGASTVKAGFFSRQ